jgi:RimJ/RimL family protein N-acetyltransferase
MSVMNPSPAPASAPNGAPLHVRTSEFELRSLTPEMLNDDYVSWWNDPVIQAQLGARPRGWTLVEARRHVQKFDNRWSFHLGIYTLDDARLIGFTTILANPRTGVSVSNRVVGDKSYWRKGVSKSLSAWAIPFAFEQLGMQKIKTEVRGPNASSIALCEYLGFNREGLLRREYPGAKPGERLDVHVFGLLREDWQAMCARSQSPWSPRPQPMF